MFEADYEKAEKIKKRADLLRASLGDNYDQEIEDEKEDPEMIDSDEEIEDSDGERMWLKILDGRFQEIKHNLLNILLIHHYRPAVLPCY